MPDTDYQALRADMRGRRKWRSRGRAKTSATKPRDDFSLALGARLLALRMSRGVSLRRLSVLMAHKGVPYSHDAIAHWERGESEISVRALCALCAALEVPPSVPLAKDWSRRIDKLVEAPDLPALRGRGAQSREFPAS